MKVERVILAEEVKDRKPKFLTDVLELWPGVSVEFLSHFEFKTRTTFARAVLRTGELAPYANVILVSGIPFLRCIGDLWSLLDEDRSYAHGGVAGGGLTKSQDERG